MPPAPLAAVTAFEAATVAAALALAPVALALAWALAARRVRAGADPATARRFAIAEVAMVAGTLPWLLLVLTPRAGEGGVQLVPLADLGDLAGAAPGVAVAQVGGNLALFAAAGCFAPIRFRLGFAAVAAGAGLGSLAVEAAQFWFGTGRVASVDDVLLNTLGAVLGALVSRRWWRRSAPDGAGSSAPERVLGSDRRDWRGRRRSRSPVARTGQLVVEGRLRGVRRWSTTGERQR